MLKITTVGDRTLHWNLAGFCGMAWRRGFWFRFGTQGAGIAIKHRRGYVPLFSERQGKAKTFYLGPVVVKRLHPLRTDEALRDHVREVQDAYGL